MSNKVCRQVKDLLDDMKVDSYYLVAKKCGVAPSSISKVRNLRDSETLAYETLEKVVNGIGYEFILIPKIDKFISKINSGDPEAISAAEDLIRTVQRISRLRIKVSSSG